MLAILIGAWVLWTAQGLLRADLGSADARERATAWATGAAAVGATSEWKVARSALQEALDVTPADPDLHERMGDLYLAAGQRDWSQEAQRQVDYAQAAAWYRRAIALRPSGPATWAMLAVSMQMAGEDGARVHEAWAQALQLGPQEGDVQPVLMQVVLGDWAGASPAMRAWAENLFEQGDAGTRRDIDAMATRYGIKFSAEDKRTP